VDIRRTDIPGRVEAGIAERAALVATCARCRGSLAQLGAEQEAGQPPELVATAALLRFLALPGYHADHNDAGPYPGRQETGS
jgi:hypothetical protein